MVYGILADVVLVLHLGFVLFVLFGGMLLLVRRAWAWVHLPCVAWAILVELGGWICPLTPLENWLRQRGGAQGYEIGFIEHYFVPILYPASLTRGHQMALGLIVLGINAGVYFLAMRRIATARAKKRSHCRR
ncbi:MAG: DUF2784 domain-containing protein [Thermodesulfobacteriota bacterium]